ncbi:MAG TPA: Kdo hydroxylase family protein [Thermoanaerobaculia bacterium]|jgi:hypothetical protein
MTLVTVSSGSAPDKGSLARRLESGGILCFLERPITLDPGALDVLLRQNPGHSRFHKNIAYRPTDGRLGGLSEIPRGDREPIRRALAEFSQRAVRFTAELFPGYARSWRVGYTSFRPFEEEGRPLRTRSRNDLMHVDAFPSRPTNGDRILRLFTNIHKSKPRVWISGGNFEQLAERYALNSGLLRAVAERRGENALARLLRALGVRKGKRSAYDQFMLLFHDFLKENEEFQKTASREQFSFAPGTTWIVFTDGASHAVLSGRHALEQTFLVARESLELPEKAPIAVLERLTGGRHLSGAGSGEPRCSPTAAYT